TPITAAGNDGDTDKRTDDEARPEHGLAVLRGKEGRGLISLACDALYETSSLAHEMHTELYATGPADDRDLVQLNTEVLACLEAAEHYRLMRGGVMEERPPAQARAPDADPRLVEPAFCPPHGAGPGGWPSPGPASHRYPSQAIEKEVSGVSHA